MMMQIAVGAPKPLAEKVCDHAEVIPYLCTEAQDMYKHFPRKAEEIIHHCGLKEDDYVSVGQLVKSNTAVRHAAQRILHRLIRR